MNRVVQGVAAVLHKPMQGKPAMFGKSGRFPFHEDAPIVYRKHRVGAVQALWIEGDRVQWIGILDQQAPAAVPTPGRMTVDIEPVVRELIGGGRLVGVPALTGARAEREDGCMVLEGWTVSRMELMDPQAAPWPDLTLTIR